MKSERESDERDCYWHSSCSCLPPPCQGLLSAGHRQPLKPLTGPIVWGGGRRTSSPWGLGLGLKSRQGPVHSSGSLGGLRGITHCLGLLTSVLSDRHQVPSAGRASLSLQGATSCSPSASSDSSELPPRPLSGPPCYPLTDLA